MLIAQTIGAALKDPDLVVEALDEAEIDIVLRTPIGGDTATHYEIFHQDRLIACHGKAARHSVVMEPAHYAGLLPAGGNPSPATPPRFDPYFDGFGEVMVRDLKLYEATQPERRR